jgi:hypothetical protein
MYPAATTRKEVCECERTERRVGRKAGMGIRTEVEIRSGAAGISKGNVPPLPVRNTPSNHSRQSSRQTARDGCRVPGTKVARRTPKRARADEKPDEGKGVDP